MNDESRKIKDENSSQINEENKDKKYIDTHNDYITNSQDTQMEAVSVSATNTETSNDREKINENSVHNDYNNKIGNEIVEDNTCVDNSKEIVDNDKNIINNADINDLKIDLEIKVEDFDAYTDENNKIYKKYNLRKASKNIRVATLNEDKLFQNLQHQSNKNNNKTSTKKKHEQWNRKDSKPNIYYSCDICPETFETKQSLTFHKEKHGNKNLYICFYCLLEFEKNVDLIEHKKVHKNERYFTCSQCEMAFSSEISYLKHTYNHLKPPYKCQECFFTAKEKRTIITHVSTHSGLEKECKKIASEKKHCKNKSFECGECGKICSSKGTFDYHMISHTNVKRSQCLYCGKAFANVTQMKVHTTIHTDERAFECNICNMKFRQYTDLKRHRVVHFDKRFECDYCGKKFLHKESIQFHIRLHTDYKPYKCPECPMSFVTSTHLTIHTYHVHVKDTFPCDVCNMKFATKGLLARHMKCKSHRNKMYGSNLKECI